jgi:Ca-activated chloride channel family protein
MKKFRILATMLALVMVASSLAGCQQVMVGDKGHRYSYEDAVKNLGKLYNRIDNRVRYDNPEIYDGRIIGFWYAETDTSQFLPDFTQGRQPVVRANTNDRVTATVLSSTEKAVDNTTDRWLIEVAERYNARTTRLGSIELYGQASGESFDYIRSGKYIPDMWTPSNRLWGDALGYTPDYDRMAGNVAGIVSRDGISIEQVIAGVENGSLQFGYTNPMASSTGLNFLSAYLHVYREGGDFAAFQRNIALMSYATPQMRGAALSGRLDAFVYESQQFATGQIQGGQTLADIYQFVPFGVRHDNPVYILTGSAEKRALLEDFVEFSLSAEMQSLATSYGFNRFEEYPGSDMRGDTLREDQAYYRDNKTGGRPVVSVFVCDVSGSMDGTPLNELKASLRSSVGVIPQDSYIGFVSFSDIVRVRLPISQFGETERDRFLAAVDDLVPESSTSMYSGLVVASRMIVQFKENNPNLDAIYRIFLLTDGENNDGLTKNVSLDTLASLGVPIYCIGYNSGSSDLDDLAGLNEAAHIRINDQNVGYALANFFKAEF